jgi:hypothetical protein
MEAKIIEKELIAKQNDVFRSAFKQSARGKILLSRIVSLHPERELIIEKVRNFNDFNPEIDDPYLERDFGAFDHSGKTYFWKICYVDLDFEWGVDPTQETCARILTVMEASEY